MNTLEQRLDSYAEAWRPEPGDKLVGTVVELGQRQSEFDKDPYPIITVETEEGEQFAFHGFHTVARGELAKLRPRLGERIGIAYHGKHEERGYERYRIIVEREHGDDPDWDAIGVHAEAEAATQAAVEAERDERDSAISAAEASEAAS